MTVLRVAIVLVVIAGLAAIGYGLFTILTQSMP